MRNRPVQQGAKLEGVAASGTKSKSGSLVDGCDVEEDENKKSIDSLLTPKFVIRLGKRECYPCKDHKRVTPPSIPWACTSISGISSSAGQDDYSAEARTGLRWKAGNQLSSSEL